jgi:hypothetical protein
MSTQLLQKVQEILNSANMPDRHTFFQIEKFIIGKEPTSQAQLWAIVRELQARMDTVEQFEKDLKDTEDNLELFDIKIQRLDFAIRQEAQKDDPIKRLNIKEYEIDIRKLQREKEMLISSARKLNNKLKNIIEEINFLVNGYEQIVAKYGKMKPLDDEEAQKEMWNEKLLEEFNLRVILNKTLDSEFVKTVLCLNQDSPVRKNVETLIENIQRKMIAGSAISNPQVEVKPKIIAGKNNG